MLLLVLVCLLLPAGCLQKRRYSGVVIENSKDLSRVIRSAMVRRTYRIRVRFKTHSPVRDQVEDLVSRMMEDALTESENPCTGDYLRYQYGGGKSTLLNILAGILAPTSGRVCYGDQEIYALSDERLSEFRNRHIGYIPQGKSAVSSLTVLENVMLPLTLFGDRDDKEAMRLMELFEIAHLKDVLPNEMSGGELRRMAIARAMMRKPEVLFADEPTGDLDDYHTKLVFQVLREAADQGAAVMVVTHEGEAADYADRVYRMDAGELDDGKEKNG